MRLATSLSALRSAVDSVLRTSINRHPAVKAAVLRLINGWRRWQSGVAAAKSGNVHTGHSAQEVAERFVLPSCKRYVVFLLAGSDTVSGGVISILSIAQESKKLLEGQDARVLVCTALGDAPLRQYTMFDNEAELFPFEEFLRVVPAGSSVLVQVAECEIRHMILSRFDAFRCANVTWSINILLQNIKLIPSSADVERMKRLGPVTATVSHAAYANQGTAARLGCQVHFLSTLVCPEAYERTTFRDKEKLIVVSPDAHPLKYAMLQLVAERLPDHEVVEIRNMTYQQYKETILRAKFSFTFGEGLDNYFVETVFSGGIGMAFYNDQFFTPDYRELPGVFSKPGENLNVITGFMAAVDNAETYDKIAATQRSLLAKKYVRAEYLENIRTFYERFFPPTDCSTLRSAHPSTIATSVSK